MLCHNIYFNKVYERARHITERHKGVWVYGIPRSGVFAAMACAHVSSMQVCEEPEMADLFVDDIIDSGATKARYAEAYPGIPFAALVDKQQEKITSWIKFPWDRLVDGDDGPQDNIRRILQYIGEDVNREGLKETPDRVVRSYAELFSGYKQDPADVFKVFDGENYDEIVLLRGIEIASTCEHHMLQFVGEAHIAYLPNKKVIGLSKLARLAEIFARRLQIQERLTTQITKALDEHLQPQGSACIIRARHLCVSCRGVQKQHSEMITSSMTGVFRENTAARQELLSLIHG